MKISRKLIISGLVLSLGLVLLSTDPNRLPLPFLMLPFIIIFLTIFLSTLFIFQAKSKSNTLVNQKSLAIAFTLAFIPVLLIIFQSLHQLSSKDVIISLVLAVGILFYLLKTDILTT
ncbi:MAG TPA: hypothetical protein VLG25_02800 [Patescibacteria group bacterium]|nr:hypothetical protein [Patescibacteria group bacterium]